MNRSTLVLIGFVVCLSACQKDLPTVDQEAQPEVFSVPTHFPPVPFPTENAFRYDRWKLGKDLFYDKALSRDFSVSCASCHAPEKAFATNSSTNAGVENTAGTRNSPSLANVAYQPHLLREGAVPTLEMQVLVPIQEHNEFDFNMVLLEERLGGNSNYQKQSEKAYNREFDALVITRAIACFERSLLSGKSAYDQYLQGDENAINSQQKAGMELFFGEANCNACHSGIFLTDYSIVNNGLYTVYADQGLKRLTGLESDAGKFKVPSLRNVALTFPYMHDGSLNSLEEVLDHYSAGGQNHANQSDEIVPLNLSNEDKSNLLAFLHSLSDLDFVTNPMFQE